MRRVFEIDILKCPYFPGKRKLPYVIRKTPSRSLTGSRNNMIIRVELIADDARISTILEAIRCFYGKVRRLRSSLKKNLRCRGNPSA